MDPKLIRALDMAAKGHALQPRKYDGLPYLNHIIEVLNIMIYGKVTDTDTLIAAVLHDAIEDTYVSRYEIKHKFGGNVLALIDEVTEDKNLSHESRKASAIITARNASALAQHIKLADLISNRVRSQRGVKSELLSICFTASKLLKQLVAALIAYLIDC
jgi:guanosine-3',5'-bis(diphosphate) 3'-pyrophosphohydrolase